MAMEIVDKPKVGVILGGGSMKCAFTSRMLASLEDNHGIKPDYVVAVSGSAGSAMAHVSERQDLAKDLWLKFDGKRLLGMHKPILDIDYLIDEVVRPEVQEVDFERFRSSDCKLLIPVTNWETGGVAYFGNSTDSDYTIENLQEGLDVLRAAKAMPIIYNRRVRLRDGLYFDTPISASATTNVQKLHELGVKKIIAVNTGNPSVKSRLAFSVWIFARVKEPHLRQEYSKSRRMMRQIWNDCASNVLVISPKDITLSESMTDRKKIREAVVRGYDQIKEDQRIPTFVKKE